MISTKGIPQNVLINSSATWAIVSENVKTLDILEQDGIYHVLVVFRTGGEGPDGATISADFEQCKSLKDAEMMRADILLKLEKMNGHI